MMTSAAGKSNVSIPTISLLDCFTPDGDIDPEKFIQRHQILTQIESASKDDDSCNSTLQKSPLPNSSHHPTGMSFADFFNSNGDVIVENFAQRRQW